MKIRHIMVAIFFLFAKEAFAVGTFTGARISYYVSNSNASANFYFKTDVAITGTPACNTQGRFAVNTATQAGKNIMTAVINAKNMDANVNGAGLGTCTTGTSEDISYVVVQ